MTITSSGLFVSTWIDIVKNDIAIDLVSDTIKCALFVSDSTWSPNYSLSNAAYGTAPYTTTAGYEVPGTGNYTQGGKTLTNKTVTESPAGVLRWGADSIVWDDSTITAAGALFYDTTVGNRGIVLVSFGGNHSTVSGSFMVACPSTGFIALDLTP